MRLFSSRQKTPSSEGKMFRELSEGSPRAQMAVYRRLASSIYPTTLRIAGNPQDAEDAMQEAFLRLFKAYADHSPDIGDTNEGLTAWLRRTGANCAIDILRRRAHFSADEPSERDFPDEGDAAEPDLSADIAAIHEACCRLPDSYRTILSLHLFEGYDYEECAEILHITQGTVRVQYLRAKRRLLKELEK